MNTPIRIPWNLHDSSKVSDMHRQASIIKYEHL